MWSTLVSNCPKYALIASASKKKSKDTLDAVGLVGDHAYTLLNVIELHGNRLLYLRNPWGRKEWSGRWSHVSSEWTAELKTAVNYAYQPGAFWISFEDFVQYYESVVVCFVKDDWHHASVSSTFLSRAELYLSLIVGVLF